MATDNKVIEMPKAEEKAPDNPGIVEIKLKKPLDYNGAMYDTITLDLENLTGKDSMEVEAELMQRKKGAVIYGALNNDYIMGIAAKACAKAKMPIGSDAFLAMSLKDYNRVKEAVRNFLLK